MICKLQSMTVLNPDYIDFYSEDNKLADTNECS